VHRTRVTRACARENSCERAALTYVVVGELWRRLGDAARRQADHVPLISHPREVARLIEQAASAAAK